MRSIIRTGVCLILLTEPALSTEWWQDAFLSDQSDRSAPSAMSCQCFLIAVTMRIPSR